MANRKSDQERAFVKASEDAKTAQYNIEYFKGLLADLDKERAELMADIEYNEDWRKQSLRAQQEASSAMKTNQPTFDDVLTEESSATSSEEEESEDEDDMYIESKLVKLSTLKRYRWQSDDSSSEEEKSVNVKRFKPVECELDSICMEFANIAIN